MAEPLTDLADSAGVRNCGIGPQSGIIAVCRPIPLCDAEFSLCAFLIRLMR